MSTVPADRMYGRTHVWARPYSDGSLIVGITDYAQDQLGDVYHVELPGEGEWVVAGEPCGVVESDKVASDIHAPVTGAVVVVNDALSDQPELVNQDPYDAGWMFRIRPADRTECDTLLDAMAYQRFLNE